MASRERQLVGRRPTSTDNVDGIESEVVQDRSEIVSGFGE